MRYRLIELSVEPNQMKKMRFARNAMNAKKSLIFRASWAAEVEAVAEMQDGAELGHL